MNVNKNIFCFILIIINIPQKGNFKVINTSDVCDTNEVLAIIKSNSDLVSQHVIAAGSSIQQHCANARYKLEHIVQVHTVPKILAVVQNTLASLGGSDGCSTKIQTIFRTLHNRISERFNECNVQTKNNEMRLGNKSETMDKWIQNVKVMTELVLEKCAIKHLYDDCLDLKNCCTDATGQITYKIIETIKNNTDAIYAAVSKQNDCFRSVFKEAINVQRSVDEEIVKCSESESSQPLGNQELEPPERLQILGRKSDTPILIQQENNPFDANFPYTNPELRNGKGLETENFGV